MTEIKYHQFTDVELNTFENYFLIQSIPLGLHNVDFKEAISTANEYLGKVRCNRLHSKVILDFQKSEKERIYGIILVSKKHIPSSHIAYAKLQSCVGYHIDSIILDKRLPKNVVAKIFNLMKNSLWTDEPDSYIWMDTDDIYYEMADFIEPLDSPTVFTNYLQEKKG